VNRFNLFDQKIQFLGSAASALLFVLLKPFLNEFATFFALIPLFYIALQHEVVTLWLPFLFALILVFLLAGGQNALIYILFVMVPVAVLCRFALLKRADSKGKITWYPVGRLAGVLVLLGFVYAILLTSLENATDLTNHIQQSFHQIQEQAALDKRAQYEQLLALLRQLIPYFPGISAVGLMLMTVGAGAIAQAVLKKQNKLVRSPLSLAELYLPWWCWKALLITGIGWALLPHARFYQYLPANMTLVLLFAFFLQGLAIVHTYTKKQANSQLFLVIIYLIMILFTWPILIVIIFGVLEPWLRLRERLKAKKE
jgi:uncharacterized protein YybS (DUF2232 family)